MSVATSYNDFSMLLKKLKSEANKTSVETEIKGVIFTLAREQFCQTYIRTAGELKPPVLHFPRLEKDERVFCVVKSLSDNETVSVNCQILEDRVMIGSTTWEARIQLFRNRKHEIITSDGKIEKIRLKDKPLYLIINIGCYSFVSNGFILHSNQKQVHDPENLNKNPNKNQQIQHLSKNKSANFSPKIMSTMLTKMESMESFMKSSFLKRYSMKVFFSEELREEINEIVLILLRSQGIESVSSDERQKDFIITRDSSNHDKYSHMEVKCISLRDFLNFLEFRNL